MCVCVRVYVRVCVPNDSGLRGLLTPVHQSWPNLSSSIADPALRQSPTFTPRRARQPPERSSHVACGAFVRPRRNKAGSSAADDIPAMSCLSEPEYNRWQSMWYSIHIDKGAKMSQTR